MPDSEKYYVVEHLKMIQNVINRAVTLSFLLKRWSIALLAASIALIAVRHENTPEWIIALFFSCVFVFWFMDAYFLSMERQFRSLYEKVRTKTTTDFSMNIPPAETPIDRRSQRQCFFSLILTVFYGFQALIAATVLALAG